MARGMTIKAVALSVLCAVVLGMLVAPLPCLSPTQPQAAQAKVSKYKWVAAIAPNYYKVTGKAKVLKKQPKAGKIRYSKLDSLKRTCRVVGTLTFAMVQEAASTQKEQFNFINPSGWGKNPQVKILLPNGYYYEGVMWNRSHLIAHSLGGRYIKRNLICGTRTQNVGMNDGMGGMAYCETKARNWLWRHWYGTLYYCVTPVYKGEGLIPRSVIVNMKSSDGTLNERVIVYNAANGYKINYRTGRCKETTPTKYKKKKVSLKATVYFSPSGQRWHTDKTCKGLRWARTIKSSSLTDAVNRGLTGCHLCG